MKRTGFSGMATTVLLALLAAPLDGARPDGDHLRIARQLRRREQHGAGRARLRDRARRPAARRRVLHVQRAALRRLDRSSRPRPASPCDGRAPTTRRRSSSLQTTIAHVPGTPFVQGMCYQWNGPAVYDAAGCEHFGVSLARNAVEDHLSLAGRRSATAGALVPVDPPIGHRGAGLLHRAAAVVGAPPVLVAEVQAPEPPETPELYGDAQWMKVFKTELQREVGLDELLGDNPIVPQDPAQIEVKWEVVQASPATVNGKRNRTRNQKPGRAEPDDALRRPPLRDVRLHRRLRSDHARSAVRRPDVHGAAGRRARRLHQRADDGRQRPGRFRVRDEGRQRQRRLGGQADRVRQQVRGVVQRREPS